MAPNSFQELLDTIDTANTKISNRLGVLDTHIDAIINSGKALLVKIKSGVLLPDQIAQIRSKINSLRDSTLANIGSKNSRISEVEKVFNELLGVSSPEKVAAAKVSDTVAKVPNRQNLLNYGNVEDLFSSASNAPAKYTVATGDDYEKDQFAKNIQKRMNIQASVNREKTQELQKQFQKRLAVLYAIDAIPDSNEIRNETHVQQITDAIEAIRVLLQENLQNPINAGLLEYLNQRYSENLRSLVGEMKAKHKPVLKYIVSLAGDLIYFTERIQRPIGIFLKADLQERISILTAVIASLPEENRPNLKGYLNTLYEERQKQSGGKRKTRCGCGLKGGRRTRKTSRRRR